MILVGAILQLAQPSAVHADHEGPLSNPIAITAELRSELRRFAAWYWAQHDLPPELRGPEFEWDIDAPQGEVNPFGEALSLFANLYEDRLRPLDPIAPYSLLDLLEDDVEVMARFRAYSTTGLLQTTGGDGELHCRHADALLEATLARSIGTGAGLEDAELSADGESIATLGLRVSVWPPFENPIPVPPPPPIPELPAEVQDVDRALKEAEQIWQNWLETLRARGFELRQSDRWWTEGVSGFDCDDFAEALGRFLRWYVERHVAGQPDIEPRILQLRQGSGIRGHAVTLMFLDDHYWIVDAQTGFRRGPFHRYLEWPPDLHFVSEHYWPGDGYEFGYPTHYPADWRPFYEDDPWHTDPCQRQRVLPELPSDIPPDSILP